MCRMLCNGELLLPSELEKISKNFRISYHVEKQLEERGLNLNLAEIFKKPFMAYYNTDGSINIALDNYEYFVVVKSGDEFVVITFKEKSRNGFTVTDKRNFALEGKGPRASESSCGLGFRPAGKAETECSGNVTKENVARLVDIGVDYISSGALTHSSPILDLSLKNLHAI